MMGSSPMGDFVAEFSAVHLQSVAAYDIKMAAAVAAALAKTHGWKLMSVMSREQHLKKQQEKV